MLVNKFILLQIGSKSMDLKLQEQFPNLTIAI